MKTVIAGDQRGNLLASTFCMEIATAFGLAMTLFLGIASLWAPPHMGPGHTTGQAFFSDD